MNGDDWYEVWADDTLQTPYLLLLRPDPSSPSHYQVVDPKEGYRVVHQGAEYTAVKDWLLEDEYTLVGRVTRD
jgi:hypothetical protein